MSEGYAYEMGFDCGVNGANTRNCHFSIFSEPRFTAAWENGKKAAEHRVQADACPTCRGTGEYRPRYEYLGSCPSCDGTGKRR
jgi:DnaJ-class molecular chaperone